MTNKTKQYKTLTMLAIMLVTFSASYCKAEIESARTSIAQFETGMDVKGLMDRQSQVIEEMPLPQPERSVMDVSHKSAQRAESFLVKALMLDMESSVNPQSQTLVPGTAAEFIIKVRGDHRYYAYKILLTLHKADGNLYQIEADASQADYPCSVVPAKQFVEPGSEIVVVLVPKRGFRSQYRMRLSVSRATAPIELLSDAELQRMLDKHQKDYEEIRKKANETKKELRRLQQLAQ